jgi:2-desacetyl-2-hydroxyethyl bacteriochlorophyllide A dehydrogenase
MRVRKSLYFTAPGQVELREESLPALTRDQVLVQSLCSAISPGTEMLVYRGQFPRGLPLDENIPALTGQFEYPFCYGYACVGRIIEIGEAVEQGWEGRLVFSFQPHTSHFVVTPDLLLPLPEGVLPESACLFPNMETAVNLVQDAAPILGERALIFGQGIVGLLTAALLREFPLASLVTCDCYPLRREASRSLSVTTALDPDASDFREGLRELFPFGADLSLELSGSPAALDDAIASTGFGGRVVIGSWYGEKKAALDLGGAFHRSRIQLISSQVSTIAPGLRGRWDKARRFGVVWEALERIQPRKWITHRFSLEQAGEAYRLLDTSPEETLQVLFTYGEIT